MSKENAYAEAIRVAVEKLRHIDLDTRCDVLGLKRPRQDILTLRAFGTDLELRLPEFQLVRADNGKPVKVADRILILHYLLCNLPINPTDELLSFRQMDSGQFYWPAFLARSVKPLVGRIGNDLDLLRKNLSRFDWEPSPYSDFSARIQAVGKVYVTLIYRLGDDEFPPSADLLFDTSIKRVYCTEDAAVLAGRICLGLL
jgi:hypothetical protein